MNSTIDWTGQLEAYHEDGRVVEAKRYTMSDQPSWLRQVVAANGMTWGFDEAGQTAFRGEYGWHIRNVPGQVSAKGDPTPEQEAMALVREMADTYVDNIPHEIARFFERADDIATPQPTPQADTKPDLTARAPCMTISEVREMVAKGEDAVIATMLERGYALPEPVDEDLIEARGVCAGIAHRRGDPGLAAEYTAGELDQQFEMEAVVATIRGRALALAGEKEA